MHGTFDQNLVAAQEPCVLPTCVLHHTARHTLLVHLLVFAVCVPLCIDLICVCLC